ncbi:MAG: NAD(P)-binding protein [Pseudomonadota bacterium]
MDNAGHLQRRDFLNGVALALGASMSGMGLRARALAGDTPLYPPALMGMRGSHPGSFEVAHAAARGQRWSGAPTDESFDLVIVGAGISGLSAAYFYQRDVNPQAKILILDNHDDFGGHARRNEFTIDGKTLIGFGGTMLVESPRNYPAVARELINELGVTFNTDEAFNHQAMLDELGMRAGYFLDEETFGTDGLITAALAQPDALAHTGLSSRGKADVQRLFADETHYLTDRSIAEQMRILETLSWREYLKVHADMGDEALAMIQKRPHGVWAIGADALPAWLAWDSGYPGFGPLDFGDDGLPGLGEDADFERVRFPDGNATIARMLVSRLIPSATDARQLEDVVTARFAYDRLDSRSNSTRIRLSSTVVSMAHRDGDLAAPVELTYVKDGAAHSVSSAQVLWSGYHAMLPHICPDVSEAQARSLSLSVRAPLVYTNVLISNWRSLVRSGAWRVNCPGSFFQHVRMTHPVSFGDYRYARTPDDPVVLHMQHVPTAPGLPAAEQFREGRRQLLETGFADFEARVRNQLSRMFGASGFDHERDIRGITVNRWSHGYAYSVNADSGDVAFYPERWTNFQPWVEGRQRIGNIAIAGTDAASDAMTEAAIEQAHRAVRELASG